MLHHVPIRHHLSAVGHRRAAVVAQALPKRRRQPGRRKPSSKAGGGEEGKQFTDGEWVVTANLLLPWLLLAHCHLTAAMR